MNKTSSSSFLLNKINFVGNEDAAVLQNIILPGNGGDYKVFIKREDLIHPTISGNKWRKLKYNLIEAEKLNMKTLLTFGGAFSNHIHAVSSAGKLFNFNTIGIIRGEKHLPLNPTLEDASYNGMVLHYIDRSSYRKKNERYLIDQLHEQFGEFYLIPEGGTNNFAVKGCGEIIEQIDIDYDYIATACGTGGTISGLICVLNGNKKIIGVPVLKGAKFLEKDISTLTKQYSNTSFSNWNLNYDFHFGGYAKISKELILFINHFEELNSIRLDPIYTGKLMFGINEMVKNKELPKGSTIIVIHTGGLQGIAGMQNKIDKLLS